ncbi:SEC-C metal-binding domain-containing protein [Sporosarcina thermotolerans]|uniref:SEC-C metal-binding domain-containing protein n=1 Tax=Sporosarcina thermotolerans TaxID=633404 RepID=A0AAW9A711_9BACL|nr:SEC-C metal-binding domain-containing protein [Sporosarcina thermotolerans]MDW0116100.1 SEC-C metal-binding domain-containing protein [Sporosarcina thermotolerans]
MKAYIVKLTFEDIDPPIWRRIILPAGATFNRLHEMIQYVTNFQSRFIDEPYHYFDIEVDGLFITNNPFTHEEYKKEFNGLKLKRPSHLKIDTYLEENGEFLYRYDSGDDWRISVELEEVVEDYYFGYPTVLAGEGTAPPEDVGGPQGYIGFLDIYHDPKHPDYLAIHEWAEAQYYKPFDIDALNNILKYVKYKKTEWDLIDHDNYNVKSDKYRGPKQLKQVELSSRDLILDYIVACTNLYGVVPQEKVREIYNGQNESVISSEMMKAMVTDLTTIELLKNRHVHVEGLNFYHEAMDYVDEAPLSGEIKGKPFYVPEKDKLLKYVKDAYFEQTPQQLGLGQLMMKDGFPARKINSEIENLVGELSVTFSNVLSVFQAFASRLGLKDMAQINSYLHCVTEIANTTRLWENRGHTPNELFQLEKSNLRPLPSGYKIGRNEPCPCGSGRKYKKCCGN